MAWLITLLQPIWQWLLSYGITQAVEAIKRYTADKAIKKERDAVAKKALDNYLAAGKSPGLTPEQKAKEQEDALEKFTTDLRNLP